jgi:peptidoglycan hydrolase-like amidase
MTRREFVGVCAGLWEGGLVHANEPATPRTRVTVQVLQLLKPTELTIRPSGTAPIEFLNHYGLGTIWPGHSVTIRAADAPFSAQGRGSEDAALRLTLSSGFTRNYMGCLRGARLGGDQILLTIEMPVEVAVGSIVSAELPTRGAAMAALAAQAVVARSFLIAGGQRHEHADFCDTTHCQFLRSPSTFGSPAHEAADATRDLVLMANGKPFPALCSAACGGHTEQADENGYLYQRMTEVCTVSHCLRSGHGRGLCQNAALALAQHGWAWERILQKYYPGAAVSKCRG